MASVWEQAWDNAQPTLSHIQSSLNRSNAMHRRIMRVGQLDCELLDQELSQLLQEPIKKALSLINSTIRARFEPELNLFVQLVLYKLSIWNTGASYGAKLQDLLYTAPHTNTMTLAPSGLPRRTLLIHGALTLGLPYLHARLRSYALSHAWPDAPSSDKRRKAWDYLDKLESLHTMLSLVNFTAFLWNGRYRTLADRLLRMRLVPSRRQVKRDVSYEFMNRQMVWHAFTEFLLFLLPLIDARTIRKRFYGLTSWCSLSTSLSVLPERVKSKLGISASSRTSASQKQGKYASLPDDQCAICAENASFNLNLSDASNALTSRTPAVSDSWDSDIPAYPIQIPYVTSCGHIYCYHCIAERMIRTADDGDDDFGWECLRCGSQVKKADRYFVELPESDDLDISGSEYEFSSDLDMYTDMSGSMGSYSESALSE